MESHLRLVKRPRLSLWLCNELVWEFCSAIPIVNTWERILLTSTNIHTYLGPRFRKMRLIYRDAIAFLKEKLKTNKDFRIRIDRVVHKKGSQTILAVNQEQSDDEFVLETKHLRVRIEDGVWSRNVINISRNNGQLECAHLHYFLRLITPLLQPIHCDFSSKPIEHLMRFLDALSDYIDSIGLSPEQFNSPTSDMALGKYNKLEIRGELDSVPFNLPKLVQWLTNGQSKKYLTLWAIVMTDAIQFLEVVKKDFARATSNSSFVVRLKALEPLDEFTLCNELTGEKLQLRHKKMKGEWRIHALSRFPNNEMDNIEGDCAEFDPHNGMTKFFL